VSGLLVVAVMLAVVLEAVVEYIKDIFNGEFVLEKLVAIVLGVLFAFGAGIDIFEMVEIDFHIPYVGTMILGLFISKGANVVHDIFDRLLKPDNLL